MQIEKPRQNEFNPFFKGYIDQVGSGDVMDLLERQVIEFEQSITNLSKGDFLFRYAPEKWTIAEVIGHMVDVERLMGFRAFCFSRGDQQSLPGFDQESYTSQGNFNLRDGKSFLDEFTALRASNMMMIQTFTPGQLSNRGVAWNCEFSVRALIYIIAGHFQHHMNVLETKYK